MIERVWHGWTTSANADRYESILETEVIPSITAKNVRGYLGFRLLRRELPTGEIEFMTIMTFDSWDAVRAFAGEDVEKAYVIPSARAVLTRFDERSAHFEVRKRLVY